MLPANMKPHVIAAVFNVETPIDGAEQRQMQVRAKVIVDRMVILHHIVAKQAVALGRRLLLPILPHHPGLHGSDSRNGIRFHETIQSNHRCASIPISSVHGNVVPGPRILEYLDQVFGVHIVQSRQLHRIHLPSVCSFSTCRDHTVPYALALFL